MGKVALSKESIGTICMYAAVTIWGGTFFFQKLLLANHMPVYALIGLRFSFVLVLFLKYNPFKIPKSTWLHGMFAGVVLFGAFAAQNFGLIYVDVSVAAFITGLAVVFTPILNSLIFRAKLQKLTIVSMVLAVVGVYFFNLDFSNTFTINIGILYCLLGSLLFSVHVIIMHYFLKDSSPVEFSIAQLVVVAICGYIFSFLSQEVIPDLRNPSIILGLAYLGLLGSVTCYSLQSIGQKYVKNVVKIGLILALEPVTATIVSVFFGVEILNETKYASMIAIFLGVLLNEYQEYIIRKSESLL